MNKEKRFTVGDVVEYVGEDLFWKKVGGQHIISEVVKTRGSVEYSTNIGAWFYAKDFKLIREADKESLLVLEQDLEDEDECDYE